MQDITDTVPGSVAIEMRVVPVREIGRTLVLAIDTKPTTVVLGASEGWPWSTANLGLTLVQRFYAALRLYERYLITGMDAFVSNDSYYVWS